MTGCGYNKRQVGDFFEFDCVTYCLSLVFKKIKKEHFLLDYLILIVYKIFRKHDGSLAQLEEHLVYTERVGSSNLSTPTNKTLPLEEGLFLWFERNTTCVSR